MPPSCIFDTCCGCIELRSGCLIIGYLNLVTEIIMVYFSSMILISGGVIVGTSKGQRDKDIGTAFIVIAVLLLLIFFFMFAFTIVLLVGIHKNKRGHVRAFLIMATILLVLGAFTTMAGWSQHFQIDDFFGKLINYLVDIYYLLVIRSYYYKMEEKQMMAVYSAA